MFSWPLCEIASYSHIYPFCVNFYWYYITIYARNQSFSTDRRYFSNSLSSWNRALFTSSSDTSRSYHIYRSRCICLAVCVCVWVFEFHSLTSPFLFFQAAIQWAWRRKRYRICLSVTHLSVTYRKLSCLIFRTSKMSNIFGYYESLRRAYFNHVTLSYGEERSYIYIFHIFL